MKNSKGITLTSLIITIIVMVILVGISLVLSTGEDGIIERANKAKYKSELAEFKEKIGIEYLDLKNDENNKDKLARDLFEELRDKLQLKERFIGNESFIIKYDEETDITLLEDGTIIDGRKAVLNIADGSIALKKAGYVQGENALVTYEGEYIITGTTTTNSLQIQDKGQYDITIKNLNIDLRSIDRGCPIKNNVNNTTDCFISINIEGENSLYSGSQGAGILFIGAQPNINGVTNGSTLTILGNGQLYIEASRAAIGGGYSGIDRNVSNIIINGGNITAKSKTYSGVIGTYTRDTNNIIINGGNLNLDTSRTNAIGSYKGKADNIVINGGNITAKGGEYGGVIGGSEGSGKVKITGGIINLENNYKYIKNYALIGDNCLSVEITGGTIIGNLKDELAIGRKDIIEEIKISGGNVCMSRGTNLFAIPPKSGSNNIYLTEVILKNVEEKVKVTSLKTSDNISYGIKDMYTVEGGKLYLYLPEGQREITIIAGGKTYTGTVTVTSENTEIFTLN